MRENRIYYSEISKIEFYDSPEKENLFDVYVTLKNGSVHNVQVAKRLGIRDLIPPYMSGL